MCLWSSRGDATCGGLATEAENRPEEWHGRPQQVHRTISHTNPSANQIIQLKLFILCVQTSATPQGCAVRHGADRGRPRTRLWGNVYARRPAQPQCSPAGAAHNSDTEQHSLWCWSNRLRHGTNADRVWPNFFQKYHVIIVQWEVNQIISFLSENIIVVSTC